MIANWFVSPFTDNDFMGRALVAGWLVALLCAVAGTFVVLRGLAFIGDALAHGVLPGVAGALLLGLPGILGAAIGAAVMIGGVGLITRRTRLSSDTAIGLLFVGMLASGVLLVSRSESFSGDIVGILFGEVLGVSTSDLWVLAAAAVTAAAVAIVCSRPFQLLSVDPDLAEAAGFRTRLYHPVMLTLVAGAVVVSFNTVGTLLVFGMLVAPAATSALVARTVRTMIAGAVVLGVLAVYVGLLLSYHHDLAAGACTVAVSVALFFVVFSVRVLRRADRADAPTPRREGASADGGRDPSEDQHPLPAGAPGPGGPVADRADPGPTSEPPRVGSTALSVGYGSTPVLSGLDLHLPAGRSLALVGTNGSGKSTLLKTLVGLLSPLSGEVSVLGRRPGTTPARVAYLGQAHRAGHTLPLRCRDIVRMGRYGRLGLWGRESPADRRAVSEAMAALEIRHLADRPLSALSGGQQQRVLLARTLAQQADVVLLDEPGTGLDAAARSLYRTALDSHLARGGSVIIATHDIGEAAACDQVLLVAGRVVAAGGPAEVLTAEHLLNAFGVALTGIDHGGHQDLIVNEEPHSHDADP